MVQTKAFLILLPGYTLLERRCQDSSVVQSLPIDLMVNGSNPPSTKLLLRMKGVASSL